MRMTPGYRSILLSEVDAVHPEITGRCKLDAIGERQRRLIPPEGKRQEEGVGVVRFKPVHFHQGRDVLGDPGVRHLRLRLEHVNTPGDDRVGTISTLFIPGNIPQQLG